MDHMEFAAAESEGLKPTAWDRWIEKAEKLIGHDLDGNDTEQAQREGTADGYSLDEALEAFEGGATPHAYVAMVGSRERYRRGRS